MATDLEDKHLSPDTDQNDPAQSYYDREFSGLTDPEHLSKDGVEGDNGFYRSEGDDGKKVSGKGLEGMETGSADKSASGATAGAAGATETNNLFNPHDPTQRGKIGTVLRGVGLNEKRSLVVAGVGSGGAAIFVVLFLMILPLKVEHIVTNMQRKFFATTESAVDQESENFLSGYVKKSVIPALTKCPGKTRVVIDKKCNPALGLSRNPVDALYTGWQQARLENKLATKYGIEFSAVGKGASAKFYMKLPDDGTTNGTEITKFVGDGGNIFDEVKPKAMSRAEVRSAVSSALQSETKWKKVLYRYKVGRLLEEKYGIKRCLGKRACALSDKITETIAEKKLANKLWQGMLLERVLGPRGEGLSVGLLCLTDTSCDPDTLTVGGPTNENGEPESKFQRDLQQKLDAYAATYGSEALADLINKSNLIASEGYSTYVAKSLVSTLVGKAGGDAAAQDASKELVSKSIPVIGWVDLTGAVVKNVDTGGSKLRAIDYSLNATATVATYMSFQTAADEVHDGKLSAAELGSFTTALGTNSKPDGSGKSAESSPVYPWAIGTTGAVVSTAAASKLALNGGESLVTSVSDATRKVPGWGAIATLADFEQTISKYTLGLIGNLFGSAITHVPGYGQLSSLVGKAVTPILSLVTDHVFPSLVTNDMDGKGTLEAMAGGADVAGNDSAHHIIGGEKATPAQVSVVQDEWVNQNKINFQAQSFFARMFSTNSDYSLLSRVALAMPSSLQSVSSGLASMLNPFRMLGSSFASIFSSKASAATAAVQQFDPYGVPQYIFPSNMIPTDGGAYWDEHCSDNAAQSYQSDADYQTNSWDASAANNVDKENGQGENTTVNPCLLVKATTGVDGALYDTSLLTPDDTADIGD